MKTIYSISIMLVLLLMTTITNAQWVQLGADIDSEKNGGLSIASLSSD